MTAAVYRGTSAVLKLYAPEADSQRYRQLLIAQAGPLAVSKLHDVVLLRSLDGLHLGTLRSANLTSIVTADLKMRQAAVAVAISSIEPS